MPALPVGSSVLLCRHNMLLLCYMTVLACLLGWWRPLLAGPAVRLTAVVAVVDAEAGLAVLEQPIAMAQVPQLTSCCWQQQTSAWHNKHSSPVKTQHTHTHVVIHIHPHVVMHTRARVCNEVAGTLTTTCMRTDLRIWQQRRQY
jgi:hypothetical protein